MYPKEYRYTKEHEWLAVDADVATVGITDFAQSELGDIVYVEGPAVGRRVEAGEVLGTVESVKAVAEIYAPVAGEVVAVNAALSEAPQTLNSDPHREGWICKIRLNSPRDVDALLDAQQYEQLISS